jgi:hypothetical protein
MLENEGAWCLKVTRPDSVKGPNSDNRRLETQHHVHYGQLIVRAVLALQLSSPSWVSEQRSPTAMNQLKV